MTRVSQCKECHETFSFDELIRCFNCSDAHCAECTQTLGADERTCGCNPLCATCRDEPTTCKECHVDGCMLCMGNGCEICSTIEEHRLDLLCDDCRLQCRLCHRDICPAHAKHANSRGFVVCVDCVSNGSMKRIK